MMTSYHKIDYSAFNLMLFGKGVSQEIWFAISMTITMKMFVFQPFKDIISAFLPLTVPELAEICTNHKDIAYI